MGLLDFVSDTLSKPIDLVLDRDAKKNDLRNQRAWRAEQWGRDDQLYDRARSDYLKDYEMQRDDNIAFWEAQNDYNSPEQQRRRLEAAGYSPQLALGNVNQVSAAGDISSPSSSAPGVENTSASFSPLSGSPSISSDSQIGSMISALSSMRTLETQDLQNEALRANNGWASSRRREESLASEAQTRLANSSTLLQIAKSHTEQRLQKVQEELARLHSLQGDAALQGIEESQSRVTNLHSQTYLNRSAAASNLQGIDESRSRVEKLQSEKVYLEKQISRYDEVMASQIESALAAAGLNRASRKWVGRQDEPYWSKPDYDADGDAIPGFRLETPEELGLAPEGGWSSAWEDSADFREGLGDWYPWNF